MPADPTRTLALVPTYNECENIEQMLTALRTANPELHVLVLDDSSPDGTADIVRRVAPALGDVAVEVRATKDGLGSAYRHGMRVAIERGYDYVVQIDADLSHDPAAIAALLAAHDDGVGVVVGSRYVPGGEIPHWPWHRRAMSKWGNRYTRWVLGLKINDTTAGFRVYRLKTVEDIGVLETKSRGYLFQIENTYRVMLAGERIVEVPITFTDRVRGQSKMNLAVMWEELWNVTWWGLRDRVLRRKQRRRS
ncbi:MAG: polyprenol monophosphomannose synthase [Actinomycetota bacterium]|nr:polyprenol monophosphomannose synthase [Acidimicrobiia bacterium]MDQ3294865.1 polyprenol monophosphomannose synthase [Actinomycetota bacterium]